MELHDARMRVIRTAEAPAPGLGDPAPYDALYQMVLLAHALAVVVMDIDRRLEYLETEAI